MFRLQRKGARRAIFHLKIWHGAQGYCAMGKSSLFILPDINRKSATVLLRLVSEVPSFACGRVHVLDTAQKPASTRRDLEAQKMKLGRAGCVIRMPASVNLTTVFIFRQPFFSLPVDVFSYYPCFWILGARVKADCQELTVITYYMDVL